MDIPEDEAGRAHFTATLAAAVEKLHASGEGYRLWQVDDWKFAVQKSEPKDGGAYLFPYDEAWFDQWDGDWDAAAAQLIEVAERSEG